LGHETGDSEGQQRYRAVSRDLTMTSANAQEQQRPCSHAVYGIQEVSALAHPRRVCVHGAICERIRRLDATRCAGGAQEMSDVKWFCAECSFEGSQQDVRVHARALGHIFGAGEWLFLKDLETMSMGVTGCAAPEGVVPTWVHANWCYIPNCSNPVLEDDEVIPHIREHVANGEWPPPQGGSP
jgi:hypothetical protein